MCCDLEKVDFAKGDGLVPVIVQDATSLRVLMLGYMNKEALTETQKGGLVTFYSRSKNRLWQKGEASGHVLHVQSIRADCDQDALLILAHPEGPTCHTGAQSCFGLDDPAQMPTLSILADLSATIHARKASSSTHSYTASLFAAGLPRIAQKVGEEGVEVALAAVTEKDKLPSEAADLFYHLLVLLEACDMSFQDVLDVIAARTKA